MEKKYIIELKDNTAWLQWVNVVDDGTVYFDYKYPEDLTPYTEPDLDAIRNEAYEKGVQDTKQHWVDAPRTCAYKVGYENGLNDAWEATRKIANMDSEERGKIFGEIFIQNIQNIYSASEAIEKIGEYEKEEIQIGNEVIYDGKRCVVVFPQTEHLRATIMNCGRFHHTYVVDYDELKKTGRHFPELVEVLKKMKGLE